MAIDKDLFNLSDLEIVRKIVDELETLTSRSDELDKTPRAEMSELDLVEYHALEDSIFSLWSRLNAISNDVCIAMN